MVIDVTKHNASIVKTGENIIACSNITEAFLDVFSADYGKNFAIIKRAHRYINNNPVVKVDVVVNEHLYKDVEFILVKSEHQGIFINEHSLANGIIIEQQQLIETAPEEPSVAEHCAQEIDETIDEVVVDEIASIDVVDLKQQAKQQQQNKILQQLQTIQEELSDQVKFEMHQTKQSLLAETLAAQNKVQTDNAQMVQQSIENFRLQLKQWANDAQQHLTEYAEEAIADAELQLQENTKQMLQFNKQQTLEQMQQEISVATINSMAAIKEKLNAEIAAHLKTFDEQHEQKNNDVQLFVQHQMSQLHEQIETSQMQKFDERVAELLIKQHEWLQQNINETVDAYDAKLDAMSNQLNKVVAETSADVASCIKNADATIDEKIQTALQQLNEKAQQLHQERMQTIEQSVADVLKENLADDQTDVISEARNSARNAVRGALASYKTDMSKELNAQLMNIQKELHNKLQLYTQSYAGGGSVATQFADGGTMNGTLNVANGQILSAGVDLASIFSGGGGGGNQTLSFNESTAALTISNGNTVSLSALSASGSIATGNYLPLTGGTVTGDVTVTGILSTTTLYATSAFVTIVDVTQYELSGFNVTGNVTVNGAISSSQVVYANGGNSNQWNSSFSTVNSNSANWLQTLSFDSSNGNLTISNGNTTSISAFAVLSAADLFTNIIDFTPLATPPTHINGRLYYDTTERTLVFTDDDPTIVFPINKTMWIIGVNKTGNTIPKGTVVYLSGAQGNRGKMWPAQAISDLRSADTIGITMGSTAINQEGYIMTTGELQGIDTRSYPEGTTLYLSPTAAGGVTSVKPQAPNHIVKVGFSLNSTVNGKIYVEIDNGYELDELHNVRINGVTNGQGLIYNSTSALWVNSDLYNGTDLKNLSANWQDTYSIMQSNSAAWVATVSALSSGQYIFALNNDGTFSVPNDSISTGNNEIQLYSSSGAGIAWYNSSGGGPGVDFLSKARATSGAVKFTFLQGAPPFFTTKEFTLNSSGDFVFPDSTIQSTAFTGTAADTSVRALTSNWQNTYTGFSAQSANNTSVYSTVNSNSATAWNYQGTDIKSLTANWQNTYTSYSTQSANNASVYTTVNSNSATWSAPAASSLTGNTLASSVVGSSLTRVGVLTALTTSGLISSGYVGSADSSVIIAGSNTRGGNGYHDFLRVTNGGAGVTNPNKYFRLNNAGGFEIINSAYNQILFRVSDDGILTLPDAATTSSNDAVANYFNLNNNSSQIYDDGNTHIHSRSSGASMWINTNNSQINIGTQIPVSGGGKTTGIGLGATNLTGYVTISGTKSWTTAVSYGYLTNANPPQGNYPGGSQTISNVSLYADGRIMGNEIDALSDERVKDIQGKIPTDKAIKFIKNVDGILYTWKPETAETTDEGVKSGFSAQSVCKAGFDHMITMVPNDKLVAETDADGWTSPEKTQLSLGYNQAIPYHHEVIKNLLERIEKLEATIKNLNNKICH